MSDSPGSDIKRDVDFDDGYDAGGQFDNSLIVNPAHEGAGDAGNSRGSQSDNKTNFEVEQRVISRADVEAAIEGDPRMKIMDEFYRLEIARLRAELPADGGRAGSAERAALAVFARLTEAPTK
jgi:hypothetical protein